MHGSGCNMLFALLKKCAPRIIGTQLVTNISNLLSAWRAGPATNLESICCLCGAEYALAIVLLLLYLQRCSSAILQNEQSAMMRCRIDWKGRC